MRTIFTCICFLLFSQFLTAQNSTLSVLNDSLPGNGFGIIESFQNKLYTYPSHTGGPLYEIDQNTGALTSLLTIPMLTAPWEYTTYSGSFVYLKGKTVLACHNNAGPGSHVIAAGAGSVDTLLSHITPFGSISSIDTMVYLLFSDSAGVRSKLYATNLNSPVLLIDSDIAVRTRAGNNEMFYIKSHHPAVYDQRLYRTNGISKFLVDNTTGSNNQIALLGTLAGDMYYTVCHRAAGMDTTWIKKCNAAGVVSVVDTIMMNAASTDHGLVGLGTKLIIPFKHEDAPYYQDLIVYDLSNNSKLNVTQNSYYIRTYDLEQTQVAANHFYFNSINPIQRYISDGTIAGTKPYGSQAAGYGNDLTFENYATYHTLGNQAAICDEFPNAGHQDEFYYGSDTGLVMYKLFQNTKSYPSHFNKIGNNTFFRIHDAAYTKMTVMKMTDCGMPLANPLHVPSTEFAELKLYPNPSADGHFNLQIKGQTNDIQFKVTNLLGQQVPIEQRQLSSNTWDLQLPSSALGVYYLQLIDKEAIHTQKIMIK
ncbi:MAG: T9SS type A sorting domain-containing protein [Chitinophagaceae bacterium]|nr:T9SS type A sorting domain-containing protein [Chitinophagaceae bacterium]